MLELVVLSRVFEVGRTLILSVRSRVSCLFHFGLSESAKVPLREDSPVWHDMVSWRAFEVVQMREASCLVLTEVHRNERVTIIHSIELLTFQETDDVVFNDWVLSQGA